MPGLLARMERPRKVALVRASRIGDFLCAAPAYRALRAALPGAEITLIGLPFVRDLVDRSPHLDRFVAFPGFPGLADQFFDARQAVRFFAQMQAERFDLAVQMHGSGVYSNPFTLMLGAHVAAGFIREGDPPGRLDAALPMPESGHEIRRWLALTTFLGAPPQGEALEFPLREADRRRAAELLTGAGHPLIGLHPAARDSTKRWPPERFVAAVHGLRRRFGGTVVVVGDAEARGAGRLVEAEVGLPVLDLSGQTSLPELGGIIAQMDLLITNDSAPAHIADALGVPTVTVFGSTEPERWGPLDAGRSRTLAHAVPCRPCDYSDCPIDNLCLQGVSVAQVVAAGSELMRMEKREPLTMSGQGPGIDCWSPGVQSL